MASTATSLRSTKPRQRSSLPRLKLGSITELPELVSPRDVCPVDKHSSSARSWSFDASVTTARASSFQRKKRVTSIRPILKKESRDRECGICFEPAMNPRRTRCCGQIFCTEHLADWLGGHQKNGSCPSCQASCCIIQNTVSLAPPPKPTTKRPPPKLVLKPRESVEPSLSWRSWKSPATAREQLINLDASLEECSDTSDSSQHSSGRVSPETDVAPLSTCRTRLTHRSGSWSLLPPYFTSRLSKYVTVPRSAPGAEDIGNILLSLAFLLTVFVALACINDVAEYYLG